MQSLNVLLIISSVVTNAKSVGDRENDFDRKRYDLELETCIENFDVHVDKIIRTQDSRAMGARYLNEAEVPARDDCMKMCCETPLCDVFVLEQKVPGSCYLFHCGSPEDFKCKFTQHRNYTSAVLTYNNGFRELSDRLKLTKHEEELNMLRKSEPSPDSTSTSPPPSTKVPAIAAQQTDKPNHSSKSHCSRFQFECRASKECIAIYNACDGVPQCSDGSDEPPELDCPTISGSTHPKLFHDQLKSLKEKNSVSSKTEKIAEVSSSTESTKQAKPFAAKFQVPQNVQASKFSGYLPFGYPRQYEEVSEINRQKVEPQQPFANQPKYIGREGEIIQYPANGVQWQGYQPQRQDENVFNFNHKASGMIPDNANSQVPNTYGTNDKSRTEYIKYGANPGGNVYYGGSNPAYYSGPNGWIQRFPQPPPHGVEDGHQRPMMSMYGNGILGSVPSDYYYEDSQFRGRYAQVPQDLRRFYNPDAFHKNQENFSFNSLNKSDAEKGFKEQESGKSTEANEKVKNSKTSLMTTSEKVETTTRASLSVSVKKNKPEPETTLKLAEHLRMNENDMRTVDGVNERPSGAILSLTLGVCITAIMITLVGCRLRVVRRRMRRNGKSPFVHDADFLVNGMYL